MTGVMIVYSSLFAKWAWVVNPRNVALCACHVSNVVAQSNQLRRAVEHKLSLGQEKEMQDMGYKAAAGAAGLGALIVGGPTIQSAIIGANLGPVRCVCRVRVFLVLLVVAAACGWTGFFLIRCHIMHRG